MGTWRCHQPWYLGKRQNEWCTVRTYQFMKQLEYLPSLTAQFLLNDLRVLLEEVRRLKANIQEACISTKKSGLFKAIPKDYGKPPPQSSIQTPLVPRSLPREEEEDGGRTLCHPFYPSPSWEQ